jgi:hypothetical protein
MESTTLAYIAGFLDADGSIFFQIIPKKDYKRKFQIRTNIAFYQRQDNVQILEWLKDQLGNIGYIRIRKTDVSDYTVVESKEVYRILKLLQPYVKLKKEQVSLGLEILEKLNKISGNKDFLEICKLVDIFGKLNCSKKRSITSELVSKSIPL